MTVSADDLAHSLTEDGKEGHVLVSDPVHCKAWTNRTRTRNVTSGYAACKTKFLALIKDRQHLRSLVPLIPFTVVFDGFEPYHLADWAHENGASLYEARCSGMHFFFVKPCLRVAVLDRHPERRLFEPRRLQQQSRSHKRPL